MKLFGFSPTTLPQIIFAHKYSCDKNSVQFPKVDNFVEITYLLEGKIRITDEHGSETAEKDYVLADFRRKAETIYFPERQTHVTVGIAFGYIESDELRFPHCFKPLSGQKIKEVITDIIETYTLIKKTDAYLCGKIFELFSLLDSEYKKIELRSTANYGEVRYAEKAKQYIIHNIEEKIYISDIANNLSISEGYLSRLFKRVTGHTVIEYVNITKLEKIKELIAVKNLSLKDACFALGFDDENYVSRIYKKYYGKNIIRNA